jgi:simple sugar transport system ATP-binding protein
MNQSNNEVVLEARGITKRFPGVLACGNIDLTLHRGEILALLGENGAGKSTLMNILYGLYHPDQGEVWIKGEKVELQSPRDAIDRGVGMVHQHFQLVEVMTVAENVVLGSEIVGAIDHLDLRKANQVVRDLSEQYGLQVDPESVIEDLPVGTQQRVEIIKALYRKADILILDEPTAVLTPQEANELFQIMHELTEQGVSIIFITHKLKEVLSVADRIGVLRGGLMTGSTTPAEADASRQSKHWLR